VHELLQGRGIPAIAGAVLGASLIAWASLAMALRTPETWMRGALLAVPGLSFAWLALPELARFWWLRLVISLAVWWLAFYWAVALYYKVGGAGPACALSGLGAGALLTAISLASTRRLSRNRWILFASGIVWVVAGSLVGVGVDLDLDMPLKQPRPGRFYLLAGVVAWHLPFALLRATRGGEAGYLDAAPPTNP